MDLKSMLNDSSAQRQPPPLHTSQSSYDRAAERPIYEAQSDGPTPYQYSRNSESRSVAGGSYFGIHSPQQRNSASTPSVGTHPVYAKSPGPQGQAFTPRDHAPQHSGYNTIFVPSPSPVAPQPPTPGSSYHHHHSSAPSPYSHPSATPLSHQRQPTRDEVILANGIAHTASRQISPTAHFQPPPATPLGPPVSYPRPSPQTQRPVSQGYDSYRRSSFGSVGSTHSRDYSHSNMAHQELGRNGSAQRTYSAEETRYRERERSVESVSPKTIPKPPPRRQSNRSYGQDNQVEMRDTPQPTSRYTSVTPAHATPEGIADVAHSTPKTSVEPRASSHFSSNRPSPGSGMTNNMTPQSTHSSLPAQPSPPVSKQPSLKRNASVISGISATGMPPRKRLKRGEVPIYARNARTKPLRLNATGIGPRAARAAPRVKREVKETSAGQEAVEVKEVATVVAANGHAAPSQQSEPPWEPSITNRVPYEDLTRRICDWIFQTIGTAHPPPGGAMFEIEAKIGAIVDVDMGRRLGLPVETETIFSRDNFRRTKFESTMNQDQHKKLNTFLNNLVQESFAESTKGLRQMIFYSHPKEADEFFELTLDGRTNLPQAIRDWLHPKHTPRVRRTVDTVTGAVKAQIIKSRIADLDIYNPRADFDYRISISIESPWEGSPSWLAEMKDGGRDRNKDRMSYRHMAYQIDLTQVSYTDTPRLEHELEVEISTDMIRSELDKLQAGIPSKYEDLVRGFVDNVRILCRQATVPIRSQ